MAMEGTSTKHTVSDTTSKSDLSQTKFVIVWILRHALINVVTQHTRMLHASVSQKSPPNRPSLAG